MKHIKLAAIDTDAIVVDVAHLAADLRHIHDPRHEQGQIYPLEMLLTLIILAKLVGEDKPSAMTE